MSETTADRGEIAGCETTGRRGEDEQLTRLDLELAGVIERIPERVPTAQADFRDLVEFMRAMASGGKRIRPRLLLRTVAELEGEAGPAAIQAACAVELLHLALLAHDDVIDRDLTRRGQPNIYGRFRAKAAHGGLPEQAAETWGQASAILAGDMLLSLAHGLLARLDVEQGRRLAILEMYERTVLRSAAGEHADVGLSARRTRASAADVLNMIRNKTSVYSFEFPVEAGARLAGAPEPLVRELSAIAADLGMIYQLRDDVLGVFGDETLTGKSVVSDLREGKETLLIAYAREDESFGSIEREVGNPDLTPAGAARIRRVLEDSGARGRVEALIEDAARALVERISRSAAPAGLAAMLIDVTRFSAVRAS